MLRPTYSLRSVLFHDISDSESSFTRGLGGTLSRKKFEAAIRFLATHYTPVSLQDVLDSVDGRNLPSRPVLVTFDDAYASVCEFAAPLCARFKVPAIFFVNAACLDNRQLALDNLVCYVFNEFGLGKVNAAIRRTEGRGNREVQSLSEVFASFLPSISLSARQSFRQALIRLTTIDESGMANEASLYLSSRQLRELAGYDFEIGDHTYSHVNCRSLFAEDFASEVDRNKAVLEKTSGRAVRSFSVPYGSSTDLTPALFGHLQQSGYEAAFLAEGRGNGIIADRLRINRISVLGESDSSLFSEIEIVPRLRGIKDAVFDRSEKRQTTDRDHAVPRGRSKRLSYAVVEAVPANLRAGRETSDGTKKANIG